MGRVLGSRLLWGVFVAHVAITLFVALHHEAWRDEADPWLLMRDGDVASMLRSASNGGAPLLFHATIWPFARAGFPYVVQQLVNLIYVWGAVLLVLRSRAFATPVKVLFAFSYFPAFEYAIVARPYGLQMLLTFAVAEAWRERRERPVRIGLLLALLANSTVHGLVTAAVAGALLLVERVSWRGLLIAIGGGLLSVAQLWPREGRQQVYTLVELDTLWFAIASMFFPDARVESAIGPALVVLAIVVFGISGNWKPVAFAATVMTALLLIFVFIWMDLRHAGLLLVVALAAIMIADNYGAYRRERLLMSALVVALGWSVVPAVRCWIEETRYAFSCSREVAEYLKGRDAVLVARAPFWHSPLVYLPGRKIWYAQRGFGTYTTWEREETLPLESVLDQAEAQFGGQQWLFLSNSELPAHLRDGYRLIWKTGVPLWRRLDEQYWIYEPNPLRNKHPRVPVRAGPGLTKSKIPA